MCETRDIITKDDTFFRKPDPELLNLIVKRLKNKSVIYIGDSRKDFMMAQSANIPFAQRVDQLLSSRRKL